MLTAQHIEAAVLTAEGKSAQKIADQLGVCRKTVERWRLDPEFRSHVDETLIEIRKEIRSTGAAVKETRIRAKKARLAALYRIIRLRKGNPERGAADWDDTGLVLRKDKLLGSGDAAMPIVEYELDTAILREITALEESIADELGERKRIVEHSGYVQTGPPSAKVIFLATYLTEEQLLAAQSEAEANGPDDGDAGGNTPGAEVSPPEQDQALLP